MIAKMPQNRLTSVKPFGKRTTARRMFGAAQRLGVARIIARRAPRCTVEPANVMSPTFTRSLRADGQEDVDARAEADESHALALLDLLAVLAVRSRCGAR